MNSLNIYVGGAEGICTQKERIIQGLLEVGKYRYGYDVQPENEREIVIVSDATQADLIFINNHPYTEIINLKKEGKLKPEAVCVFNVLDLAENCLKDGFDPFEQYYEQLKFADVVGTSSKYVSSQIHRYFGNKFETRVIGNPTKDITNIRDTEQIKNSKFAQFKYLFVGRIVDPNKRALMGLEALLMLGVDKSQIAVVGGFGLPNQYATNLGVVSDEELNELYNCVDYVIFPSLHEGIGLPILEAALGGAIPIVCSDLTTFSSLNLPLHWGCFPHSKSIAYRILALEEDKELKETVRFRVGFYAEDECVKFNKKTIAENILDTYGEEMEARLLRKIFGEETKNLNE